MAPRYHPLGGSVLRLPAVLLAIVTLCCGPATSTPPGGETNGDAGGFQRVVSLAPALTEIVFALELEDRLVGVTDYCDHPAEARDKARVGGYVNPSIEAIVTLEPDAVLVSPNAGNQRPALAVREAGLNLVVIPADTLDDTYAAIHTVARLGGVASRGDALVERVRARIERVGSALHGAPPRRALFSLQLEPIVAAGADTLPGELLVLAGGANVITEPGYPRVGVETVIDAAPEIILHAAMDKVEASRSREILEYWSRWPSIPAARGGDVRVFDASAALRPGPRVGDAVEQLARMLHPDRFPE